MKKLVCALFATALLFFASSGSYAATLGNVIAPGSDSAKGSSWSSPNGNYHLDWQKDGNLVLYDKGGAVKWQSGTNESPAPWERNTPQVNTFRMQGDGNAVIYRNKTEPKWTTSTMSMSAYMEVLDVGQVAIFGADGKSLWQSGQGSIATSKIIKAKVLGNVIKSGETPPKGSQWSSPNGNYFLFWQEDGNLVLKDKSSRVIWASNSNSLNCRTFTMKPDGDASMDCDTRRGWSTGTGTVSYSVQLSTPPQPYREEIRTKSNPGAYMEVRDAGQIAVVSKDGTKVLWSSAGVPAPAPAPRVPASCPKGTVLNANAGSFGDPKVEGCMSATRPCPVDTTLTGNTCSMAANTAKPSSCQTGKEFNGQCASCSTPDTTLTIIQSSSGKEALCWGKPTSSNLCPNGQKVGGLLDGGKQRQCLGKSPDMSPMSCRAGETLRGKACVNEKTACPSGLTLVETAGVFSCQSKVTSCPAGTTMVNASLCSAAAICPPNTTLSEKIYCVSKAQ